MLTKAFVRYQVVARIGGVRHEGAEKRGAVAQVGNNDLRGGGVFNHRVFTSSRFGYNGVLLLQYQDAGCDKKQGQKSSSTWFHKGNIRYYSVMQG